MNIVFLFRIAQVINKEIKNGELIITDIIGQNILQQKVILGTNEISIYNFTQGIYFYSITENSNQIICGKLIVE